MADDENQTPDTPTTDTPPAADAQQPAALTFSKEEFEARLQQERDAVAAKVRRETEARLKAKAQPPKQNAQDPAPAPQAQPAATNDRAFEDALADALAEQSTLTKDQRQLARKMARLDKPENVDDYIANLARTFGVPATQTQTSTSAPSAPQQTPPPASPPPVTGVPSSNPEDIRKWTEDQWAAYYQKHAVDKTNPLSFANWKVHQEIGKKLEEAMARVRIKSR